MFWFDYNNEKIDVPVLTNKPHSVGKNRHGDFNCKRFILITIMKIERTDFE